MGLIPNPNGVFAALPEHCWRGKERIPVGYYLSNSQVLFRTVVSVPNSPQSMCLEASAELCKIFSCIGKSVVVITHSTVSSGVVPVCFKHAVVQSKKLASITPLAYFRPFFKLPFILKILVENDHTQLRSYLETMLLWRSFSLVLTALSQL